MKIFQEKEITTELNDSGLTDVFEMEIQSLPIERMDDRVFEILIYRLIVAKSVIIKTTYTNVYLMEGTRDKGRDTTIYSLGEIVGVVQCKRYLSRISKNNITTELFKFIMFASLDEEIRPNASWEYAFCATTYFSEDAVRFYTKETPSFTDGELVDEIEKLRKQYKTLEPFDTSANLDQFKDILSKASITIFDKNSLISILKDNLDIFKQFFRIAPIIDEKHFSDLLKENAPQLIAEGIKLMSSQDVAGFATNLSKFSEDFCIRLGIVNFFGYHYEFFKDNFVDIANSLKQILEAKAKIEMMFMDFLQSEIDKLIYTHLTMNLLMRGEIHPFSIQVAKPLLFAYCHRATLTMSAYVPTELLKQYHPDTFTDEPELLLKIKNRLIRVGSKVIAGDFSDFSQPENLFDFKKKVAIHTHQGIKSVEQMNDIFEKDMSMIMPQVHAIEEYLKKYFHNGKMTLTVQDSSFLESSKKTEDFVKGLQKIEKN